MARMFRKNKERILPYLRRLHGYAQFLTHDVDRAEDLVQEASVRALAAKYEPEEETAYCVWLFRITKNLFIDRFRQQQRRQTLEVKIETIDELSMEYHISDDRFINQLAVRDAIKRIKPDHAEILAMIDVAGLSYREAADVLDLPVGTIMSRISRARGALLSVLDDQGSRVVHLSTLRKENG